MPEFLETYPDVALNIDVSDRQVDMISESYDLVVRVGTLPDSDLIARELFSHGYADGLLHLSTSNNTAYRATQKTCKIMN